MVSLSEIFARRFSKKESKDTPKVMLVDDSKVMLDMLADIFEKEGFEILNKIRNADQVIEQYNKLKPDLVVMDIVMPNIDDVDLVKDLIKEDSKAKIVVCSALSHDSLLIEAVRVGAKNYITKPFQSKEVIEAAKKALNL